MRSCTFFATWAATLAGVFGASACSKMDRGYAGSPPAESARYESKAAAPRWRAADSNPPFAADPVAPRQRTANEQVATFGLDVDTGSYTHVRRLLQDGADIPDGAVRTEEFVQYFGADALPERDANHPFGVQTEVAPCPWDARKHLLRVQVAARDVSRKALPPANIVLLLDVSGSMAGEDRLTLLQEGLRRLVRRLRPEDRLSIVTYAGSTEVVLGPTPGSERARILSALDSLEVGGGTNGGSGIELAYRVAQEGFIDGGINRILLGTDGDFNVGVTGFDDLLRIAKQQRGEGVSLSTLGVGTGNYHDHLMEQLADAGDGTYAFLDSAEEAHRVLVEQMTQTLATVAKDVKLQLEFNPQHVRAWRQIGFENRQLAEEQFRDDSVDAGDVGAGAQVTAFFEVELKQPGKFAPTRTRRYANPSAAAPLDDEEDDVAAEIAHLRIRYLPPEGGHGREWQRPIERGSVLRSLADASDDFRFLAAVAAFGQLLRGDAALGGWTAQDSASLAASSLGEDPFGRRAAFVALARDYEDR